jgi:glycosyltransferase involved in cell wall biosynthesis
MIGPFGLQPKGTMSVRALPMAQALVRRGHAVRVIVPPWDYPQDVGRTWQAAGVEVENIELPAPTPGLFHVRVTRALIRRALDFKPDVVHCFKPKAYAGLSAWALWQLKRWGRIQARLIVDTDDWEGAGGWNDRDAYSWPQRQVFAWQEKWGLTHNDGVTVASRALESIVWSLGVKRKRVAYVPNGVRSSEVRSPEPEVQNLDSGFRILLYTRFFEFKVERLLEVWRRLVAEVPDARLVVVGKGLAGEEDHLLKQAEAIGLSGAINLRGSIEYAGWVATDKLSEYFAQADIALFPFDDTLINRTKCSVKLIDLLAAGLPVIADAVGQNTEYIRHNETGVLVASGDVAAMAQAAIDLAHDRARARRLGVAAARDVRERFGWERLAETVERLYRSVE